MIYYLVNYGFIGFGGLNFVLVQIVNDFKDVGKYLGIVLLVVKNICGDKVVKKKYCKFFFCVNKCLFIELIGNLDCFLFYIMIDI